MENKEPLCSRCAQRRRTCCQICEIYVTPGDVQRIRAFTGRDDFYEFRRPADPGYLDQDDDPEWARCVFRPDGTRRVLRRTDSGDCSFLGPGGCQLPWEVRPLVCRLYPVEYTADGLKKELADGCPSELLPPGQDLLQALDMTWEKAANWHRQLYAEIHLEPHVLGTKTGVESAAVEDHKSQVLRVDGPASVVAAPAGPNRSGTSQTSANPSISQMGTKSSDFGKAPSYPISAPKAT